MSAIKKSLASTSPNVTMTSKRSSRSSTTNKTQTTKVSTSKVPTSTVHSKHIAPTNVPFNPVSANFNPSKVAGATVVGSKSTVAAYNYSPSFVSSRKFLDRLY